MRVGGGGGGGGGALEKIGEAMFTEILYTPPE